MSRPIAASRLMFVLVLLLTYATTALAAPKTNPPGIRTVPTPFGGSTLFVPNDDKPHPGVLVLHGSDGGTWPYWMLEAQALAYEGYAALAYCYASCPSGDDRDLYLPRVEIHNVELRKTYDALEWLSKSSLVGGKKVALYGYSRGAEHALLLASLMADDKFAAQPAAVAVHAPSDVIWAGWNWQWGNDLCRKPGGTWNEICGVAPPPQGEGIQGWLWNGDDKPVAPTKRIEIERFKGDIFIVHGELDRVWPADMSSRIQKTLESAGKKVETHLVPGEGHIFKPDARLQERQWLLQFLSRVLGK